MVRRRGHAREGDRDDVLAGIAGLYPNVIAVLF